MNRDQNDAIEGVNLDANDDALSPLEKVKQHQAETQQSLQQRSENAVERVQDANAEVPGQGVPSDIRHHPQRDNRSHNQ